MTPNILMLVSGIAFAIFAVITIANFTRMWNKMREDGPGSFGIGAHAIFGLLTGISALALVVGIIWFLIEKYAK